MRKLATILKGVDEFGLRPPLPCLPPFVVLPAVRLFSRWILVLSLSFSIGLPWAFIQGAAWVGMIVNFSREAPLVKSIEMTFDGEHPCSVCKAVQRGQHSQDTKELAKSKLKIDLATPERHHFVFAPPVPPSRAAYLGPITLEIEAKPPVPPPRLG